MRMGFNPASGMRSISNAIDFLEDVESTSSNMIPYYKGLEQDIVQSIKHEFDYSNPNKWKKISTKWRDQKRSEGKPDNIGIYTGALLKASSDNAIKTYYPTGMTWRIADVYSLGFTYRRKIGITTGEFLRTLGKKIAKFIVSRGTRING